MSSFNPKTFTDADSLRRIDPGPLIRFLEPWSNYFARRGVDLKAARIHTLLIDKIAKILREPDASVPEAMVDALYYVHETASHEDMEDLLSLAAKEKVELGDHQDVSPADVAVQIWLAKPMLLQQQHTESLALRRTNFMYFAGSAPKGKRRAKPKIGDAKRRAIQDRMDDWFEKKKQARGSRILDFRRGHKIWFLVRHGMPFRREGKHHDDGETGIAAYRPQKHDVLIYDGETDEIGLNASTKGERELYLKVIGEAIFGSPNYFNPSERYTLDPLREKGPQVLACQDIAGLASVRLVEFGRFWGGKTGEREIRKSENLFQTFGEDWKARLEGGMLTHATFKFAFENDKRERSATIRPANIAKYDREADEAIVEAWLKARGFWV